MAIEERMINHKKCIVAFIDEEFEPCDEEDAVLMKVIYPDGAVEFRSVSDERQATS